MRTRPRLANRRLANRRLANRRRALLLVLGLVSVIVPLPGATALARTDGPALTGGGSSFAKLEIDQWRAETATNPYNLGITYVAQGSTYGRQQYSSGAFDFAASDIPFTDIELNALQSTNRKDFVYVPVSAGGLGFMYNLVDGRGQQVKNLNLTPTLVCRMFTDATMLWNDPGIQAVNPDLLLPNERVRAIVRSDGSGTSYVLSEYCLSVAKPVWDVFVASLQSDGNVDPVLKAGLPSSNWPPGIFGSAVAADGVAAAVADSSGIYGITYNEAGFAKIRNFPNANMLNAGGQFTQPTEDAVSRALGYATARPDGTFKLDYDGPDPAAYFPSTYSYVIAQTTGFDPDKGRVLAKYLCYAITRGQRIELTEKLAYARLSAPLVELGKNAIAKIPGAPPWDECKVESAPPPPAATTIVVVVVVPSTTLPPAGGALPGGATTTTPTNGTTPSAGTPAPSTGTTIVGSGGPTQTTVVGGTGPAGTVAPGGGGSGSPAATSIAIDPVTGESVVVTVNSFATESGCTDPLTGLAAACDASTGAIDQPTAGGPEAGGQGGVAAPAAYNPPIEENEEGPGLSKIVWWLIQGASVCAIGVALAGARRRAG